MATRKLLIFLLLIIISTIHSFAQQDSLVFTNNEHLAGEIKSLEKNVLKMETGFSDDDFLIEWNEIKEIYTVNTFLITLTNGSRYEGKLESDSTGRIKIIAQNSNAVEVNPDEIITLNELKQDFWDRAYVAIDFGFNLTKANNLKQFSMRSNLGYKTGKWQLDLNYNTLNSNQNNTEQIERTDGGTTFKYFLPKDWYPLASMDFLTNNEQQINLRSTLKLGIGNYIINNSKAYWGFSTGVNYNMEDYSSTEEIDRKSWEGFLGTELNLFNTGDIDLLTRLVTYPGITEKGRFRADFKFDIKYDLPLDFYIKLGFTFDFDNQPASGSAKNDYVFHTGVGWSL